MMLGYRLLKSNTHTFAMQAGVSDSRHVTALLRRRARASRRRVARVGATSARALELAEIEEVERGNACGNPVGGHASKLAAGEGELE